MQQITIGSLFDGIGAFPYAASIFGIKTIWASEILPSAISVTLRHFPDMVHVGDITKLSGELLPPVDIMVFGSPCQDLSTAAGVRKGLAGERSGLFMEAIRIINEMRCATNGKYPRYAVWENVPGCFSSNARRDYKAVLEAFTETEIPMPKSDRWATAGMVRSERVNLAWCVYDACRGFGLAQRRKRVFLVADFGKGCPEEILLIPKSLRWYPPQGGDERERITGTPESSFGSTECRVYGICSLASNSMKSANPHSGVYEAETSRTLDMNCGNPSCNQGGMAIVCIETEELPSITMRVRCGCEGGGKGALFQTEKSGTLATGNDQTLFCIGTVYPNTTICNNQCPGSRRSKTDLTTAYCLQGSMVGREDKNGPAGKGVNEEISFTLNAADRHAVAVDCRNYKEIEKLSGTLQAKTTQGYSINYQNPVHDGYIV